MRQQKCSKCEKYKDMSAFYKRSNNTPRKDCKSCVIQRQRANLTPSRLVAHKVNSIYTGARRRAIQQDIPFNLEKEDIQIPAMCPILGIELDWFGPRESRPSLDKIIPSLGYTKGNVQVISSRANRLKSDGSVLELEAIIRYIKSSLCE